MNVNGYRPPVPAAGTPDKVAVPVLLAVNVTPEGSAPVHVNVGVGEPLARTVNDDDVPTVKVAEAVLVNDGAWPIARVNDC